MNIDLLLKAAEFVDKQERVNDHGYALSFQLQPTTKPVERSRSKLRKEKLSTRSVHNELEKNRRAQLRQSLEQLRKVVPLSDDTARHTTLGLLTRAKNLIKKMVDDERRHDYQLRQLNHEHEILHRKLDQLNFGTYRVRVGHSVSECSSTSSSSSNSISPEPDEVDVIGCASGLSDSEDQSNTCDNIVVDVEGNISFMLSL